MQSRGQTLIGNVDKFLRRYSWSATVTLRAGAVAALLAAAQQLACAARHACRREMMCPSRLVLRCAVAARAGAVAPPLAAVQQLIGPPF